MENGLVVITPDEGTVLMDPPDWIDSETNTKSNPSSDEKSDPELEDNTQSLHHTSDSESQALFPTKLDLMETLDQKLTQSEHVENNPIYKTKHQK